VGVRVAIVDPLPIFRHGATAALTAAGHLVQTPVDVALWAADPIGGVVVLTVLSEADWTELTELSASGPAVKVLALLEDAAVETGLRAVKLGAVSVLSRHITTEFLCHSVDTVAGGHALLPSTVMTALATEAREHDTTAPITPARIAWLRALASGITVSQLASRTGYSERAMYRLLRSLYRDLGVGGRVEALILAQHRGWLS
jgi:DNA-binding NarL/FixJ family response regulator